MTSEKRRTEKKTLFLSFSANSEQKMGIKLMHPSGTCVYAGLACR
jgi:hypothetical protein